MSESTSGPSRRHKAPPNRYSQAEHYESLALFLAARNLPVPDILKRPAQEKNRLSRSDKRRKHVEHDNNPAEAEMMQNDVNDEHDYSESSAFPPPLCPTEHLPPHEQQPDHELPHQQNPKVLNLP